MQQTCGARAAAAASLRALALLRAPAPAPAPRFPRTLRSLTANKLQLGCSRHAQFITKDDLHEVFGIGKIV